MIEQEMQNHQEYSASSTHRAVIEVGVYMDKYKVQDAFREDAVMIVEVLNELASNQPLMCWCSTELLLLNTYDKCAELCTKRMGHADVRKAVTDIYISNLIHELNHCSYGAGLCYELYSVRKNSEVELVLSSMQLTDEQKKEITSKTDYQEDIDSNNISQCSRCEAHISEHELAQSLSNVGEELCGICLGNEVL